MEGGGDVDRLMVKGYRLYNDGDLEGRVSSNSESFSLFSV